MADAKELQALDNLSSEVDDTQIKVILATHCIKAQAFLAEKLKKQTKRSIETCGIISSANMKLQSEITQAEQEIIRFQISKETIKMANVELKKELLVAKEKKIDMIERTQSGEKKYEDLWLECKNRYESLPHVQKLMKAAETAHSLKNKIATLDRQAEGLVKKIEAEKEVCLNVDRERIIQLAEFAVHEKPKLIAKINEKSKALTDFKNEIKNLNTNAVVATKVAEKAKVDDEESDVAVIEENKSVDESALIMPKLKLDSLDLDDLISVKLDQVKMKKVDYTSGLESNESFSKSYFDIGTSIYNRKADIDDPMSSYFSKPSAANKDKSVSYASRKLINILEDVTIDTNDAMDMISKVNPDTFKPVESISAEGKSNDDPGVAKNQDKDPIQTEDIDMKCSHTEDIVKPPTQFLDGTLKTQKPQVSFDLPDTSQNDENSDIANKTNAAEENTVNESINSQLDVSDADDGFMKIKDMLLKKHNLDLTPPFVYAKNTMLQMMTEEKTVTSKFFKSNANEKDHTDDKQEEKEIAIDSHQDKFEDETVVPAIEQIENSRKVIEMDLEQDMIASSPKKQKMDEPSKPQKPFGGYLFSHGPQGLPESLDLSMSTTGYDEADFPHCIDSSLLLSPKADQPTCSGYSEVQSQEAPNFLSGLRKTGLSFFGCLPKGDSKPDSSALNNETSGFSFNFGGEEKKNRGGLFSMFQ